ncbi:DUF4333 domain-containing protein [Candidatus Blastococcus massiliensis]|uniref:DUF4333 domain-containing protein n=1 Tax=Candidatus Blastococcus massiliensis TaxID=1470358 RepID=UPI0004B4C6B8|nr:DUF4333 domain-containing protein [Candidatus Blastococcus massiliensis]
MSDPDMAGSESPPAAPPRARRRLRPLYGWLLVAVVVAGLAVARWAGLGPTFLDRARVESDIAEQFEERYEIGVDVDCPRGMGVIEGREYECEAVTDDEELTLVLTITDEEPPAYVWDVE